MWLGRRSLIGMWLGRRSLIEVWLGGRGLVGGKAGWESKFAVVHQM